MNPSDEYAFYYRGLTRSEAGDQESAIYDFDLAINLNSSESGFFYSRGYSKHMKGNYEGAILDYEHALEINSNIADYSLNLKNARSHLAPISNLHFDD